MSRPVGARGGPDCSARNSLWVRQLQESGACARGALWPPGAPFVAPAPHGSQRGRAQCKLRSPSGFRTLPTRPPALGHHRFEAAREASAGAVFIRQVSYTGRPRRARPRQGSLAHSNGRSGASQGVWAAHPDCGRSATGRVRRSSLRVAPQRLMSLNGPGVRAQGLRFRRPSRRTRPPAARSPEPGGYARGATRDFRIRCFARDTVQRTDRPFASASRPRDASRERLPRFADAATAHAPAGQCAHVFRRHHLAR